MGEFARQFAGVFFLVSVGFGHLLVPNFLVLSLGVFFELFVFALAGVALGFVETFEFADFVGGVDADVAGGAGVGARAGVADDLRRTTVGKASLVQLLGEFAASVGRFFRGEFVVGGLELDASWIP